jgi:hypothetical protein
MTLPPGSQRDCLAAVGPRHCALALAIPLTREAFEEDLAHPEQWDYAASVLRRNRGLLPSRVWDACYAPLARWAGRIGDQVERLGVTVHRALRLADLTGLLARFKVVTLVAHWRCPPVVAADIRDPGELMRLARSARPGEFVREAVKEWFGRRCPELLDPDALRRLPPESVRDRVACQLDGLVAPAHAAIGRHAHEGGGENGEARPRPREAEAVAHTPCGTLTRVDLEQSFPPEALAPGRAVEFRDGLRTAAEVTSALPEGFTGVLDLTVCNSMLLGQVVRRGRPHCLVCTNRYLTTTDSRLLLYKLVVTRLAHGPMRFIDAVEWVRANVAGGNWS